MKDVTAAILKHNGKILIAKRAASDKLANMWEFPGGKVEPNETPEESLKREMEEEFGIIVSIGEYVGESIYKYDDHGAIRLLAFKVAWDHGDLVPMVHDDVKWVTAEMLSGFDFLPADIPFVKQLMEWKI